MLLRSLIFGLLLSLIGACASDVKKKQLIIATESWQESKIFSCIAKKMLEREGVEVIIKPYDLKNIYDQLTLGKVDLFLDVWDNSHNVYTYQLDQLEDLGVLYEGARIGMAVPTYMHIDSLNQCAADSSVFGNIFYTLEKSAGVTIAAKTVFKSYGMEPVIVELSERELMEHLGLLVAKKKPFLVAAWTPHWMFARYDLKYIADSTATFNPNINIHMYARAGFKNTFTDEQKVLRNLKFSKAQIDELLELTRGVKDDKKFQALIYDWMKNHPFEH